MAERLRWVLLHHTGIAEPHYDLMIERGPGESLMSWQLRAQPFDGSSQLAREIPDHRRAYLDYEGTITQNRGQVQRIAVGQCRMQRISSSLWIFETDTGLTHHFHRQTNTLWIIEPATPPE